MTSVGSEKVTETNPAHASTRNSIRMEKRPKYFAPKMLQIGMKYVLIVLDQFEVRKAPSKPSIFAFVVYFRPKP